MRKVVVYELLSLDGIAEQPDEFITDFDEIMRENLGRVITCHDAVLLGRRTYDDWLDSGRTVTLSHSRASSMASRSSWSPRRRSSSGGRVVRSSVTVSPSSSPISSVSPVATSGSTAASRWPSRSSRRAWLTNSDL